MIKSAKYGFLLIFVLGLKNIYAQQSGNYVSENVDVKIRSKNAEGKVSYSDWKPFETRLVANIKDLKLNSIAQVNKYGNSKNLKVKATGFFRTEKIAGKWWVIDPQGYSGLNIAVNSITIGRTENQLRAFDKKYKDKQDWISKTISSLQQCGFNGAGSWSDYESIINYNKTAETPFNYSVMLNLMSGYGSKRGGTFTQPGHKGYPSDAIFAFDPGFEKYCNDYAKKLTAYKNDPNLFGYFTDNELPFGIKNLDGYLSLKSEEPGFVAAESWLKKKGVQKDQLTDALRTEFLAYEAEVYFSTVCKAIRKYDPNHMIIGSRFHSGQKNVPEFMAVAGKYLDVISINYYGAWTPQINAMKNWEKWSGKPFMITEFYTKGEDSGLPNLSGAGWQVKTQLDRGKADQNFCMGLLESNNCVGWHWFKYQDNDPTDKQADPSNTDANKGLINTAYNLYEPMTGLMKELNTNSYQLIEYFIQKK